MNHGAGPRIQVSPNSNDCAFPTDEPDCMSPSEGPGSLNSDGRLWGGRWTPRPHLIVRVCFALSVGALFGGKALGSSPGL